MADTKITALAAIATVDPAADVLPIVDISDTSMAASGTTKKVTSNQILGAGGTATLASATITGAATVGTTLGVTGASTLASVGVTGAATVGTTLLVGTNATLTNGNVIIGTSGKGIDFGVTTPDGTGTVTAELLNDYEEGTFTPTIAGSTIAGVGAYSGQSGKYTKVGNLVTVQIYLNWSALTGGTGNMRVGNLPFTNTSNFWPASVGYLNNIALTAGSVMTAFVDASAAYIALWQYPTGGGAATEVPVDAAGAIVLSASYTVA